MKTPEEINQLKITGEKLYKIRMKKKITINELSNKTKISVKTLKNIEAGIINFSVIKLLTILDVFNITPFDFFKDIDEF